MGKLFGKTDEQETIAGLKFQLKSQEQATLAWQSLYVEIYNLAKHYVPADKMPKLKKPFQELN